MRLTLIHEPDKPLTTESLDKGEIHRGGDAAKEAVIGNELIEGKPIVGPLTEFTTAHRTLRILTSLGQAQCTTSHR